MSDSEEEGNELTELDLEQGAAPLALQAPSPEHKSKKRVRVVQGTHSGHYGVVSGLNDEQLIIVQLDNGECIAVENEEIEAAVDDEAFFSPQGPVFLSGSPLRGTVSRQADGPDARRGGDYEPAVSDHGYDSEEDTLDGGLRRLISQKRSLIRSSDKYVTCLMRAHAHKEQNKKMKADMKERLYVLDTKYNRYSKIADRIQISIIVLATVSAFVQASSDLTTIPNIALGFMSLCVSTYTGLLLSIAKYTKLDDKKEQIHNLQIRFSEFITTLDHREEKLAIWTVDTMWAGVGAQVLVDRYRQWVIVEQALSDSYASLCEVKTQLCGEFDKVMDSGAQSALGLYAREERLHLRNRRNDLKRRETDELTNRSYVDKEYNDAHSHYRSIELNMRQAARAMADSEIAQASGAEDEGRHRARGQKQHNIPLSGDGFMNLPNATEPMVNASIPMATKERNRRRLEKAEDNLARERIQNARLRRYIEFCTSFHNESGEPGKLPPELSNAAVGDAVEVLNRGEDGLFGTVIRINDDGDVVVSTIEEGDYTLAPWEIRAVDDIAGKQP